MEDVALTLKSARVVRLLVSDPGTPRYGYELMRSLHISSGTLYPILAKLTTAGWISRQREDVDTSVEQRPARMLYHLTPDAVPVVRAKLAAISAELSPP